MNASTTPVVSAANSTVYMPMTATLRPEPRNPGMKVTCSIQAASPAPKKEVAV
jgi:hypothetical protein